MKEAKELIKKHEGFRGIPYIDSVGKKTIGYGRNIDDVGFSDFEIQKLGLNFGRSLIIDPLTRDEGDILFENDFLDALNSCFSLDINFGELDEVRAGVIVNMMFNLGYTRLSKFKKTLAFIKERLFVQASVEMLDSRWAKQVHKRAFELSELMDSGKW